MNYRIISRISVLLFFVCLLFTLQTAQAQRFEGLVSRSMYTDKRAFYEGDVVTILLMEFTEGQAETGTATNSDNQLRADAQSTGIMDDILPSFGLNSQLKNRHDASGSTKTRGRLSGKMTASVLEVMENGLLSIQGTRMIDLNGEQQTTVLTGLVRPEDIRPDNTVYSFNISNAEISYKGKGAVTQAGKPGIIARIWNWIF